MTDIKINIIKHNKFILRDYIAVINEIIFNIELITEKFNAIINLNVEVKKEEYKNIIKNNNTKINKLNQYKMILKEYINSNFASYMCDYDLNYIYSEALTYVDEDCRDYPSIFNEIKYNTLKSLLKDISTHLLEKDVINDEVYNFIDDYVNNSNNYSTWLILYHKCCYIHHLFYNHFAPRLFHTIESLNTIQYYNNIIRRWPFGTIINRNYNVVFIQGLYSLYDDDYNDHIIVDSDDEEDDNNNEIEHPLINKYTLINNNNIFECDICYEDNNNNYYKCNNCIFKLCIGCFNKYKLLNCAMCRQ
jgi:hypothetical protein